MPEFDYPYSTEFFMDTLGVETVEFDIVRFDEFDSQGTGHDMQSEMADPKWTARMTMRPHQNIDARRIAAKQRKLDGSALTFMVYDPSNPYPYADPKGVILGGSTVRVASIGSNNTSLALKALPPGYVITTGDKGQINFGSGNVFFFEFSEDVTASGAGLTAAIEIYPHVDVGIAVDQIVILRKPACKMTIMPDGFNPGRSRGPTTSGVILNALEHV